MKLTTTAKYKERWNDHGLFVIEFIVDSPRDPGCFVAKVLIDENNKFEVGYISDSWVWFEFEEYTDSSFWIKEVSQSIDVDIS